MSQALLNRRLSVFHQVCWVCSQNCLVALVAVFPSCADPFASCVVLLSVASVGQWWGGRRRGGFTRFGFVLTSDSVWFVRCLHFLLWHLTSLVVSFDFPLLNLMACHKASSIPKSASSSGGIHDTGVPSAKLGSTSSSSHAVSPLCTSSLSASTGLPSPVDKKQTPVHRNSGFLVRLPTIDEYSDSSDQEQINSPISLTSTGLKEVVVIAEDKKNQESAPGSIIVGMPPLSVDRMSIQSDDSVYSTPRGSLSSLNSATGTFILETSL